MKRQIINLFKLSAMAVCAVCAFASCQFEEELPDYMKNPLPHFQQITFEAVSGESSSTRTIVNGDGSLSWLPNDEINIFCGQDISGRFISDNTEIAATTTFTGHFNTEVPTTSTPDYWAVYPYMSTNTCDGSSVTLSVPTIQISSPGTFGAGAFPSVARSNSTRLAFYNVCGAIKFTLTRGDIDMITLSSNGKEPLAGKVRVTFGNDGKPVAEAIEGQSEVTVRPSSGGCFETGQYYYMTVLPVKMNNGFTMTFHTVEGEEGTIETANPVTIKRSASSKKERLDSSVSNWHASSQSQDLSETGVYLGILAFNQQLYSYPVGLLTANTMSKYKSFIDGLQMKNGTLLYYGVDSGLLEMQQGQCPKELTRASLITFTDGLDQGSLMMNPDYETDDRYLSAVSSRIHNANIFGMPLMAFSVGIRGNDVSNTDKFRNNLVKLASSEDNVYEISSISSLYSTLAGISETTASVIIEDCHNLYINIPGLPDGTRVRFTFDELNATNSKVYIDGTFNLGSRTLSDVTYYGLSSMSGPTITGIENGIFVRFEFLDLHREDGVDISNSDIQQWHTISNGTWQKNTEFDTATNVLISADVSRKSSIVYLVLDCSSSLDSQFSTMKKGVKDFIQKLYDDSYIEFAAKSIEISSNQASVEVGESVRLSATVYPATASDRTYSWSSSNTSIATVDEMGNVTGVKAGQAIIYATASDGGYRASCGITVFQQPEEPQEQQAFTEKGFYLGMLAFNQDMYYYPVSRVTSTDAAHSFIYNTPIRKGTLLYSAVEHGLSHFLEPVYPDNTDVCIVTFTDCLDQGSSMKLPYLSVNDNYFSILHEGFINCRFKTANKIYQTYNCYSVGMNGNDSRLSSFTPWSSNSSWVTTIDNVDGLIDRICDFADLVWSAENTVTYASDLSVVIPGVGSGTKVRFTFDNVSDASQSELFIEGTFNLTTHSLTNVSFCGFSSDNVTDIAGTVNGIFVRFDIKGLHKNDNTVLDTQFMKEWTLDIGSSIWQINSEFNNSSDVITEVSTTVNRGSLVLYLIMDYSTSIYRIEKMKSAAYDLISRLFVKSNNPSFVSSVSLNESSLDLIKGESVSLTASIYPSSAVDKSVVWTSSDSSVAAVTQTGEITAVGEGIATITAKAVDGGYTATCSISVKSLPQGAVDLGLSVMWSSCNLGAANPFETGHYYAWGETSPKSDYSKNTYKWNGLTLPKVLEPEDDAAHVSLGGNWRIPTSSEFTEICSCYHRKATIDGVKGTIFSGSNGNSIFFPASGGYYYGSELIGYTNGSSYYWTNCLLNGTNTIPECRNLHYSLGLFIPSNSVYPYITVPKDGWYGCNVRAVKPFSVSGISLDRNDLIIIGIGSKQTLTASLTPSNATNKDLVWTSSDESVATVTSGGEVTAKNYGTTTITVTAVDGGYTATCSVTVRMQEPEAVDLGLSVKWGSFNLGASTPNGYGHYYAWGETSPKSIYDAETYKWCEGPNNLRTKYCSVSTYGYDGFVDNKTVLEPEDDAAHVALGGNWRMPTQEEFQELIDNCSFTKNIYSNLYFDGCTATGPNGKSVYFPSGGFRTRDTLEERRKHGYYWTSSRDSSAYCAYLIRSSSVLNKCFNVIKNPFDYRFCGCPIRPVCDK